MTRARKAVVVQGVPYYRFVFRFRLADGRRRRWVRWSAGWPWIRSELTRELQDRFEPKELMPGSGTIVQQDLE